MPASNSNNNKEVVKDHRYVLEKIEHIDKLYDSLGERLKTNTFITVISIAVFVWLAISGGIAGILWKLSNNIVRVETLVNQLIIYKDIIVP